MIDSRSVNDLHPAVKRAALELQRRLKQAGWNMGISSTYRDNERQDALYAQGRTRPGNIVTNARGGQSIHNYRLAFDIFNNVSGNMYPSAFMKLAGKIGTEMGLEWGGSWTGFRDEPHFQFTNGLTLAQLQGGRRVPEDVQLRWEKAAKKPKEDAEVVENRRIQFNGRQVDAEVIMKNGETFIRARALAGAGVQVGYAAEAKMVLLDMPAKEKSYVVDGQEIALETVEMYERNFIPVRELEKVGCSVGYDAEAKRVWIGLPGDKVAEAAR